ncbi:MAG: hypothetical protein WAW37_01275 [Syntrophobacteraceae bacterium]
MKILKSRPSLLPIALCALIAVLVVKLAVMVGASLPTRETISPIPGVVLAGQEKPADKAGTVSAKSGAGIVSESHAAPVPTEKAATNTRVQGRATSESLSFIQQRESELRRKEEQLKEKEERLAKIEQEVEQKTKDLLVLQKEIQSFRSEKQDTQNSKVKGLAKIYGTMKPKEAAKLLENLDDKLVMGIVSTMTSDEAAAILSIMEVKKAAKISEALSGR